MRADIKFVGNVVQSISDFKKAFKRGRLMLKSEIVKDTSPLTPLDTGALNRSVIPSSHKDDEYLVWNTPYAHFINEGKAMIDPATGSAYARKNASKVYSGRSLRYHNPDNDRRDHFYDRAKKKNREKWAEVFNKGAKRT